MAKRIFITVGEASGDQHAAHLIGELKQIDPTLIIEGLGGPKMAAAGAKIHRDTVAGAAMGWEGALRYVELRRLLSWSGRYFRENPPDLQICIDSWSMNWHWAKLAHGLNIPVFYYISPQMWASRPWRVKKMKRYVDRVACILPFEEKFFRDRGVDATFVGHPIFDAFSVQPPQPTGPRFPDVPPVIGVLAGSRSSVARKNFRNLLDVVDRIRDEFPKATFLVPTTSATHEVVKGILQAHLAGAGERPAASGVSIGPFTLRENGFDEMVPQCDLCLTVSGTATLHVAIYGSPLIVVYRINPVLWHLFVRWVVTTRTYSLVNLLNTSQGDIVPEFIPWYGSNTPVAEKALEFLHNPKILAEQRERLQQLVRGLARPGASRNAAKLAVDLLEGRDKTKLW